MLKIFCKDAADWVFTLHDDYEWESNISVPCDMAFADRFGVRRLEILQSGRIRVLEGYSWDGCTPKACVLDLTVGVPDGVIDSNKEKPKTYYASLVHDALYQFKNAGLPYSRYQADLFFLRLMAETGFRLRYIYFAAVVAFGGIFGWFGRLLRKSHGRPVPYASPQLGEESAA